MTKAKRAGFGGVGVGFKAEHFAAVLEERPDLGFFEVHAENYMGAGGPPHRRLEAIRERYPLSLHGVGLSIGSPGSLDCAHLARLARVAERYEPAVVSEHLAWSTHDGAFLNDLLPLPYTEETLERVCEHIDLVQTTLGRTMLLENPSTYVAFAETTMRETNFLGEIVRRTGCGLLLDVNNIFVSATNHGFDPYRYLADFPLAAVGEIHLAGCADDRDDAGFPLLIDAHDSPVRDAVWLLYAEAIRRLGATPTLIEWDNDVPAWPALFQEARRAERAMAATTDRKAERIDAV
ncbi:MAG: DUF692 domain-containing protein [Hyphomicrobiales bacterium]|nr:DUF692 domain-containing protein [Hyphomicrobiales bacterium]MBV8442762.1 DUF692 domain-containing protein [Hyphomicrobiales bacterium]